MTRMNHRLADLLTDLRELAHDLRAALDTFRRCRALRRGACPDTVEF